MAGPSLHAEELGPEPFRFVDLDDRSTWHLATLTEWFSERQRIDRKLGPPEQRPKQTKKILAISRQVTADLGGCPNRSDKPLVHVRPPAYEHEWSKEYKKRLKTAGLDGRFLTTWETHFYRVSHWLDEAGKALGTTRGSHNLVRDLLERSLHAEASMSAERKEKRELNMARADYVSVRGSPRTRHPFLPEPLELIQVNSLVKLCFDWLAPRFELADQLKLIPDEYGASFPCPKCDTKYYSNIDSLECCRVGKRPHFEEEYRMALVRGGRGHRYVVVKLVRQLLLCRFDVPVKLEELMAWPGWGQVCTRRPVRECRDFTGFLFRVHSERYKNTTIKRKLAKSNLARLYKEHGVPVELRLNLDSVRTFDGAIIGQRGWYRRIPANLRRPRALVNYFPPDWPFVQGE